MAEENGIRMSVVYVPKRVFWKNPNPGLLHGAVGYPKKEGWINEGIYVRSENGWSYPASQKIDLDQAFRQLPESVPSLWHATDKPTSKEGVSQLGLLAGGIKGIAQRREVHLVTKFLKKGKTPGAKSKAPFRYSIDHFEAKNMGCKFYISSVNQCVMTQGIKLSTKVDENGLDICGIPAMNVTGFFRVTGEDNDLERLEFQAHRPHQDVIKLKKEASVERQKFRCCGCGEDDCQDAESPACKMIRCRHACEKDGSYCSFHADRKCMYWKKPPS
jgi:RNA:NAD 2'-phosphotransferase (TPT1/KptA family)